MSQGEKIRLGQRAIDVILQQKSKTEIYLSPVTALQLVDAWLVLLERDQKLRRMEQVEKERQDRGRT